MKLLNTGTPARFSGTDRIGLIAGYANVQEVNDAGEFETRTLYVLDLGKNGFYSPGRDVFVSLMLISEENIETLD